MQDLPYFKAFPSDWEQAMRRADIPPADRGDVYRLVFFAWADGGLKWEDEGAMRSYAREMGWQWRRFVKTLEHYKRLCSPASKRRLPFFLLRNLKQSLPEVSSEFAQSLPEVSSEFAQSLPEVSSEFAQSLPEVSSEFAQSLPEVSSEFDAPIAPKSFIHGASHGMSESIVRIYSQNTETERSSLSAVEVYRSIYPDAPIYHQETIETAGIDDLDLWRQCVADWKTNRYSARNIAGLISFYRQRKERQDKKRADESGDGGATRPPVVVAPPDWGAKRPREGMPADLRRAPEEGGGR